MARAHVLACLVGIVGACVQAPEAKLTAASREDPACGAELRVALDAIRTDNGLGFAVEDADVELLQTSGALEKRYARDATQFTVTFGLELGDDGDCALRLWSMAEQRPGWSRTQAGNFGAVSLAVCRCI